MKLIIDYWCEHTEVEIGYLSHENGADFQVSVDKENMDILEEAGYVGNFHKLDPWDVQRFGNKEFMVLIARLPEWRVEGNTRVIYTQEERL